MKTTYEDVVYSFNSTFADKHILPDGLVKQWFLDSVGEFSLDVKKLLFDVESDKFSTQLEQWEIRSLGLMMKIKYCTREVSRINKINNIIGKDISLNNTDSAKKQAESDMLNEMNKLSILLSKQKPTAYV